MHMKVLSSYKLTLSVFKLSALQWRHLSISAFSKTFVEKRITKNCMQNRMWNSCLDFIKKEILRLNSPNWTLWITAPGKIFEVNHKVSSTSEDITELMEMLQMTV